MQVASMDSTAVTTVQVCGHYVQFRGHMQNNVTARQKAKEPMSIECQEKETVLQVYIHV